MSQTALRSTSATATAPATRSGFCRAAPPPSRSRARTSALTPARTVSIWFFRILPHAILTSCTVGNRVGTKLWQCYDGLAQQTWYYTDDNRIAVEGQGQCLDLTGGILDNGNVVQTWVCTDGNTNQIWN